MVDQIIPTTPCPCFTCESLQQELAENCGATIDVIVCCCGTPILISALPVPFITGPIVLQEVGPDKIRGVTGTALTPTSEVLIPLNRIGLFVEVAPSLTEGVCPCTSCNTFAEELAAFCGMLVNVEACICGAAPPAIFAGFTLVEVSPSFIELRNTTGAAIDITIDGILLTVGVGQDIIIPLNEVCFVQVPVAL